MSLTSDDVAKIAHLARLAVDPNAIEGLERELSSILDLVEQMDAAATEGIEPMAHPLDVHQRLRNDAATETNRRDVYQALSPAVADGLFLVPKVIE